MFLLSSFFRLAAALPAPFPNPETKGKHWYHGTSADFHDSEPVQVHVETDLTGQDHHTVVQPEEPGGHLRHHEPYPMDYGYNAAKHWNTDLGTHFASQRRTARQFATSGGSNYLSTPQMDSRVAHCSLHMANPKHYDSEWDLTRHAIRWAQENGHKYDHEGLLEGGETRDAFIDGEWGHQDLDEAPHLHPAMDGFMLTPDHRHSIADIDEKGPGDHAGEHLDHYLRYHPEREEITSGFKQHLRDQGHDGIVYGNEYEGEKGHKCAIAFDDDRINLHRWEWLHEKSPHHVPRPEPSRGQQPKLLKHTPWDLSPWKTFDGRSALLRHFASGTPIWRQPKPQPDRRFQDVAAEHGDDAALAWAEEHRKKQSHWVTETRKALSRGDLKPEEAKANGYHGLGHDQATHYDTFGHGLGWKPLPQTLWHVTTNKSGVLADGTLRSRDELSQRGGNGLGGGESDTISFTDDLNTARHIHRALHEYHGVLTGRISPKDLMEQAKAGGFEKHMVYSHGGPHPDSGEWKSGDPYPQGLQDNLDDVKTTHRSHTVEEAKAKWGDAATPHPASRPIPTKDGDMHTAWRVRLSGDERMHQRSDFYKTFAMWRGHVGGPMDPGFIGNDPKGLAALHPSQFAILRHHPKPGAQGYQVSALGEWRTADGSAVPIAGTESPHAEPEGLSTHAAKEWSVGTHEVDPHDLIPYRQHRTTSDYHRARVKESMPEVLLHLRDRYGPVLWDGNHTLNAALEEGLPKVRVRVERQEPRTSRKTARVSDEGFLENPYHTAHNEWFHGTIGEHDDLDPQAIWEGHRPPGNGAGGPQMNKLLGVHFSPLHDVAHSFAGPHHSTAHGRIFHANLRMKNPIHFESEEHLLRHVWNTTMRSDYFHDEKHDGNQQWNYGGGATREGINRRLDAPQRKNRPTPHSSMESYLQFHPRQKEIAEAYVSHLRYEGYDGITYGNAVEGPRNHHCAIAFDPKTIKVTHVDRMHPSTPPEKLPSSWGEEVRQKAAPREGEVSHAHIRSIHGEPEDFLTEVERYHNGGFSRTRQAAEEMGFYGRPDYGKNTGRGEWKFTASKERIKVYRGIHLTEDPEDFEDHVRRQFDHIQPVGSHWTTDPEVAQAYAGGLLRRKFQGAGVVLHGTVDAEHVVPHHEVPQEAFALGPEAFEKEVYIRPGAPVHVHNVAVHWHGGGDEDEDGLETEEWEDHADEHHDPPLRVTTALLPGYTHEHDWLPDHGIFSATKGSLDPVLFDRNEKMRPKVKQIVLDRMDAAVREVYPDWQDWCRNYLAGGSASYWWGNRDLDILVGVNYKKFRKAHPEDAALSDDEISAKITGLFRKGYNDEHWIAPWDGEEWHVTAYSNPASWNIRDIKPYSAYLIDTSRWVVKPPRVPEDWGPHRWDEGVWDEAESYLHAIEAISRMKDPAEQARRGAALYDFLHGSRRNAFGSGGKGWKDGFNAVWKYLEYHPSGAIEKLVRWVHQNNRAGKAAA